MHPRPAGLVPPGQAGGLTLCGLWHVLGLASGLWGQPNQALPVTVALADSTQAWGRPDCGLFLEALVCPCLAQSWRGDALELRAPC